MKFYTYFLIFLACSVQLSCAIPANPPEDTPKNGPTDPNNGPTDPNPTKPGVQEKVPTDPNPTKPGVQEKVPTVGNTNKVAAEPLGAQHATHGTGATGAALKDPEPLTTPANKLSWPEKFKNLRTSTKAVIIAVPSIITAALASVGIYFGVKYLNDKKDDKQGNIGETEEQVPEGVVLPPTF